MCVDCKTAKHDWAWGGYTSDCLSCFVRALAVSGLDARGPAIHKEGSIRGKEAARALRQAIAQEESRIADLRQAYRVST